MPIVVSNNLIGKLPIPSDAIIRINLAWVNKDKARALLQNRDNIYLDYPTGRRKPPKPQMTLQDAIELAQEFPPKYFAISNVETVEQIQEIKSQLPGITIVPKIETVKGIENLEALSKEVEFMMLDKEDLYVDCNGEGYEEMVEIARKYNIIELIGVIFQ